MNTAKQKAAPALLLVLTTAGCASFASSVFAESIYLECDVTETLLVRQNGKIAQNDTYQFKYQVTLVDQKRVVIINVTNAGVTYEGSILVTPKAYVFKLNQRPPEFTENSARLDRETGRYTALSTISTPSWNLETTISDEGRCVVAEAHPRF
jgi:hypothetical protein